MQSEVIKVPLDRVGALVGVKGLTKREIERKAGCRLSIDSESGEVEVSLGKGTPLGFLKALNVVKAIARGFSPERAFELFKEGMVLDVIELSDVASTSRAREHRRGRVIGKKGKARKEIEENTNALISVYGKTISIIGTEEAIEKARKSVELLVHGASHETVFRKLEHGFEEEKFDL
ncbi:MAG: hypothetical protein QT03_C0001G1311 [archaeon GW2011_AR10]|uniref:RNA-processing protein n=1 Tax=Candidatus Iainarchaeum sp. TaxID=3101447 RepID=A0A7J4IZA4_9ARCH|nr:MAG: hypothetical protein QT03_C0001G1311 [archaeon GW2011_AR10]HIH08296.1 RNA-processing protein [Candidatus Diapherotrites archaeon]